MTVTVKCEKCGADNRLGQLFCRECGAKLDLSKAGPQGGGARHRGGGTGFPVGRMIRLTFLLALLAVLGLLCWPAPPAGDAPSVQGERVIQGKMTALRGAILRRNEVTKHAEEADINAHLNTVLISPVKPAGFALHLREVRLDLQPRQTEVWMTSALGPLTITYRTLIQPEQEAAGQWRMNAGAVRVGHFPLPGPLRDRALGQMAGVFQRLQEERILFGRLGRVRIVDGALELSTVAAQP